MRVWFNRHFAAVARVARLLRESSNPLPLEIAISHRHADFIGFAVADIAFTEPADLPIDAYVDWVLEKAVGEKIDVIMPGHEATAFVAAAPRFQERGVRVFAAAAADVLPNLHRKEWVYEHAPQEVLRPLWKKVSDDTQLEDAIASIEQTNDACIKPTVSVYGLGYHRIAGPAVRARREPARDELSIDQWRGRYGAVSSEKPQIVMAYLPGHEYSVDMACQQGVVLAQVIRRKPLTGSGQLLVAHAEIELAARALVSRFALSGLINIQFKDDAEGRATLLEINPRASGGIAMSCLSGLNLPDIAYRACFFDERCTVPVGRLGIRVAEMPLAFIVPEQRWS